MQLIFQYMLGREIDPNDSDSQGLLIINQHPQSSQKGERIFGTASEFGVSFPFELIPIDRSSGEWLIKWEGDSKSSKVIGLLENLSVGDIITRISQDGRDEYDYQLTKIMKC